MSKRKPPPTQIKNLKCDADTRDALTYLVTRRIQVKDALEKLEAEQDDLNSQIMPLLKMLDLERVALEDWTCGIKTWGNSHVSKDKLFDMGVPLETIAACTTSKSGETIDVRGPRDRDKDG